MRPDGSHRDPRRAVLSTVMPGRDGDAAAVLPPLGVPRLAVRRPSLEISSPIVATLALAAMFTGCCLLVLVTTAEPDMKSPAHPVMEVILIGGSELTCTP